MKRPFVFVYGVVLAAMGLMILFSGEYFVGSIASLAGGYFIIEGIG